MSIGARKFRLAHVETIPDKSQDALFDGTRSFLSSLFPLPFPIRKSRGVPESADVITTEVLAQSIRTGCEYAVT